VGVTECVKSRTRYGRETKASLTKFTEFDGVNVTEGNPAVVMDCDKGNPRILELVNKILKDTENTKKDSVQRSDPIIKVGKGRIRVELKVKEKKNNKSRMRIKACKNKAELRTALMEEKVWKVTFLEMTNEDKVPGLGWCGYLVVDQVRRNSSTVQTMDVAGAHQLTETLDDMIKTSRGGVRQNWGDLDATKMTNREILFSVRDTLSNWGNRLTDGLKRVRWLNAKNIYGSCQIWDYSQWGTDSVDPNYCELSDCVNTQSTTTNY
jgi:hypothetical protein